MQCPTKITVRIKDFPSKSAMARQGLCQRIAAQLAIEYPHTDISVVRADNLPSGFEAVITGTPGLRSGRIMCVKIHGMVKEMLEHAGSSVERQKTNLKHWTKAELGDKAVRLLAERQAMEVALRKLVDATSLMVISDHASAPEAAKVEQAVSEAKALLGKTGGSVG